MKRSINKTVDKEIDNFLIREKHPSIKIVKYDDYTMREVDLFANIEARKHVIGFLTTKGLDPFKRGTKEPIKIIEALGVATWPEVETAPIVGISMWD